MQRGRQREKHREENLVLEATCVAEEDELTFSQIECHLLNCVCV
jgi:NADPH-dependent 7-cyano-7-deazaguanine reductase QueF